MTNIKINLLPLENRLAKWHYSRLLMLPVVITILIISAFFGSSEYRAWDLEQQLMQTRAKYDTLAKQEQQMQLANARQIAIQARQKILLQLSSSRVSWHSVLAHMGTLMPRNAWLTEIGSAQKAVLQMKGNVVGYQELILFLGRLEVDKTFIEPALLRLEQVEKEPTTKFEITVKIRGM